MIHVISIYGNDDKYIASSNQNTGDENTVKKSINKMPDCLQKKYKLTVVMEC